MRLAWIRLFFHCPQPLGTAPLAFGAELRGDAFALGNHALIDLFADAFHVIETLDAHIHQLDTIFRDDLLCFCQYRASDLLLRIF